MLKNTNLGTVTLTEEEYLEFEQFSKFFEFSGDLLCIAGFDGYFKKINPTVIKVLGYTEEELFARPINEFVFKDDQDVTIWSRSTVHQGKTLVNFENRYLTKTGEIVWLSWTSIPQVDRQQVFAVAKNVTEKKRQEEERNIFLESLSRINQDLKQFTRMTSHDIRSPLNNILSIFGLLDLSKIADEETVELVKLLKTTSEHLNSTVNNFVDVLIKNDQLAIPVEELDLGQTLHKITSSISSLILSSETKISIDFSAFDTISFNKMYMESILLNLITNAIKYVQPGQSPYLVISTRIFEGVRQLQVKDKGMGFDMEKVKDKIFGLYQVFSSKPESKGIGLHLVYTHVTALGGKISVESEVNEGAIFTISFKTTS